MYNPKEESIIAQIEQVDELQLDDIIGAVIRRYSVLRPDRELGFLTLSTDPHVREKEIEDIEQFIRICYKA